MKGYSLVGILLLIPTLSFAQLNLIPQPRELEVGTSAFHFQRSTRIVVTNSSEEDRFAATTLQEELRLSTGKTVSVISATTSARGDIVVGRLNTPALRALLSLNRRNIDEIKPEGYVLEVQPERVIVAGKDEVGVFYGVQTLRQMISANGENNAIPAVHVRDWPSMLYRGTQVDLSRGPVPTLATLARIVRTIAEFKMNQLNLYMEDAFPLQDHPLVGVLDDQLTRDDFRKLVAYASSYHVDIIPESEGCGHLHKVLRFDLLSGMGERAHGQDLAAHDQEAAAFLNDFYSQLVSVFPSQIFNVGCDETTELGKGRSADLVKQAGYAKAYLDELQRAYNDVHRYNKRVMFWGDMAIAHPEIISSLPKDVIVASWQYFPQLSYEKWIKPFTAAGLQLIVCPWVGNTDLIVPDYDIAASNIKNFITEGKRAGALGVNVTVWNDDGQTLYDPNWWSIIYAAANAWEAEGTDVAVFDRKFDWAFYRSPGSGLTTEIKKLSHINEIFGAHGCPYVYSSEFGAAGNWLFWRDPFSELGREDMKKLLPAAAEIRRTAEEAFERLRMAESSIPRNANTLRSIEFAALRLDALALRYQGISEAGQKYAAILQMREAAPSAIDSALFEIQGNNGPFLDLRDYTTRLREMCRQLWLQENLSGWLPNILQLYDQNSATWQRQIADFERIKWEHRAGKPLPSAEYLHLPTPPLHP